MDDGNNDNLKNKETHPQLKSCFLSNIFFCSGLKLFYKGWSKELNADDLYKPFEEHESQVLGDQLENLWELEKKKEKHPYLLRPLWKLFKKQIIIHAFWAFILEFVLKLSQPVLLGKLIEYYNPNQTSMTIVEAYLYSSLIVLTSFLYVLVCHWYHLSLQHLGMKIRVACCSLIYRKSLRLSKRALVKTTIGQMINLLSNDVNRFDNIFRYIHYLWVGPLESIIIMYLIYNVAGFTGLAGFIVLVLFIPFQMFMGKLTTQFRQKTAIKTDERVRLMSEIICGIQVIKMYTWEKSFSSLVDDVRKSEIKQIRLTSYIRALHMSFNKFITRAAVFLCILVYTFTGHRLNAGYVYVISSFYNILKSAISNDFPQAISQAAEALVSIDRIENFLGFDEVQKNPIKDAFEADKISNLSPLISTKLKRKSVGVYMENVSAKWTNKQEDNTLYNINFNVGPKQLVAIVGGVGSGKTSLLHVIMKELPLSTGKKDVVGKISYASQEPWLFAGTIKQNILFGESWNPKKYEKVIKICALERDLSLLSHGDRSLVGDRGVSISGGQRARINLARAIYKEADIYILDDPLSAVDAHVGKQIFEDCISGYLRGKCTILVTHQLQYLKNVSKIFLLERGTIATSGVYKEICESNVEFAKSLKHHVEEEECDDTIDEETSDLKYFESLSAEEPTGTTEEKNISSMSSRVYTGYLKYAGGWCYGFYVLLLFILTQFTASGSDFFVKEWVNIEQQRGEYVESENLLIEALVDDVKMEENFNKLFDIKLPPAETTVTKLLTPTNCIYIYSFIIASVIVVTILRSITFYNMCMKASVRLHSTMFNKVCNSTMAFFNTNPSGRILNRFSKDIGCIDEILPNVLVDTIQIALNVLAVNIVIATVNPWILITTVLIGFVFYFFKVVYVSSSRNLKRMEATTRSPVFSHIHASLQGLTTLRAFEAQTILKEEFDKHQDLHSSAYYLFVYCNRTFGFWLDILCVLYIGLVTFSFFVFGSAYGGNVGLAITQAISLTGMFQWGMRQWSELDNSMTSVERVLEYTEIKQEIHNKRKAPPKQWPENGTLEFQSVYLRYATNLPYVLNKLTFKIKPKQKVGIVGRTGAGKSTLISALFRLANIEGKILIDGVCTSDIPLKSLRSKIAIIPQEPVLFSGTLRSNLDPMNEHEDFELWSALDDVALKAALSTQLGLEMKISEGGSNLSLGQRQLVCLARAILRKNKILVLDEATANVDPETDALIQTTIRDKFANCTVLTIAHRLHTVMDSDKVLVMDAGSAVEFGHPYVLLQNQEGIFYSLVKQTGKSMAEYLFNVAEQSYKNLSK